MKRDAATISAGAILAFDVAVVGGGPVGLSLASALASAGRTVCLLDSAAEQPRPRRLFDSGGKVVGLPYCRIRRPGSGGPGGSSWFWEYKDQFPNLGGGFRSRPLQPIDFEQRSWVPNSGWPLPYEEVARWYPAAHELAGLVFRDYTGESWTEASGPPPLPLGGAVESTVYQFGPPYRFQELSAELSEDPRVTLIQRANVTALEEGASPGEVSELRVASPAGGSFHVRARASVLAAGGIENPRLLLNASFGRAGSIGNPCDTVGRYYLEHPFIETGELAATPYAAAPLAFYRRHRAHGGQVIGMFRVSDGVQRAEGLLNAVCEIQPRHAEFTHPGVRSFTELNWGLRHWSRPGHAAGHVRNALRDAPAVWRATLAKARGELERDAPVARLLFTMEQVPNARSRVTLGTNRDAFGIPKPVLDWRVTPVDSRSVRRTQEILEEAFVAAGLGPISQKWDDTSPNPRRNGCWHNIGTTRMSASPEDGVVDSDCRVHGMRNLFVAGSSVLPTAGAASITLTLVALALRLADHLNRDLAERVVTAN